MSAGANTKRPVLRGVGASCLGSQVCFCALGPWRLEHAAVFLVPGFVLHYYHCLFLFFFFRVFLSFRCSREYYIIVFLISALATSTFLNKKKAPTQPRMSQIVLGVIIYSANDARDPC
jgi:hypothetical protein